jgi:predicted CoA-substrate-specific enzyme activase
MPDREDYVFGIDVGSSNTKIILTKCQNLQKDGSNILGKIFFPTAPERLGDLVERKKEELLKEFNIKKEDVKVVATGYGRRLIKGVDKIVSEIIANAEAVRYLYPDLEETTIVDIGGQDTKAIALDKEGRIKDFAMNDRCAAGCGRFLEVLANRLEVSLPEEFAKFAKEGEEAGKVVQLTNTCTVFIETEIISLLAQGRDKPSIIWALCEAIARRIMALIRQVGISHSLVIDGGVANNLGVIQGIKEVIKKELNYEGIKILVPKYPEFVVATGAALQITKN